MRREGITDQAEAVIPGAKRIRGCVLIDHGRRTDLIPLNPADLPSPSDFARDAMCQISLSRANRQFIKITDDKGVGNVLIADRLFALQVIRVLSAEDAGVEACLG